MSRCDESCDQEEFFEKIYAENDNQNVLLYAKEYSYQLPLLKLEHEYEDSTLNHVQKNEGHRQYQG